MCGLCSSPLHCIELTSQSLNSLGLRPAGAPAALLFGWLSDKVNRKRLLFAAVVLGASSWRH
jgi:MFS family permease